MKILFLILSFLILNVNSSAETKMQLGSHKVKYVSNCNHNGFSRNEVVHFVDFKFRHQTQRRFFSIQNNEINLCISNSELKALNMSTNNVMDDRPGCDVALGACIVGCVSAGPWFPACTAACGAAYAACKKL